MGNGKGREEVASLADAGRIHAGGRGPGRRAAGAASPLRLLLVVLASVFVAELGLMVALRSAPGLGPSARAVIDATALTGLMVPCLYFLLFRPMSRQLRRLERSERENAVLVAQLRYAVDKVKTLRGLIPICAVCNRLRDERGRWDSLESFIQQRTEATLSTGCCPECEAQRLGPPGQGWRH